MKTRVLTSPIHNLEIEFPPPGTLARRSIHRGQLGKRYKRRSVKSISHLLKLESKSEFIYSCILDCAYWVSRVQEQPAIIKYRCSQDNAIKKHYPDFLVTYQDYGNPTFVEIKSDPTHVTPEVEIRTIQLKAELQYLGFEYKIIIISNIPSDLINNCNYLLRLARFSHLREENLHIFFNSFSSFKKYFGEFSISETIILSNLFIDGHISFDMLKPINSMTMIEWSKPKVGEKSWHKFL